MKPVKVNSRDCASLLTTCNMFKLCSSVFLVYYEYVFVYCDAFVFTISFLMSFLSILNRFHTLISIICCQFCIESRRSHQRCFLKLHNIYRKAPVLGLFLIKLLAFRFATILKRGSNTGVSWEIYEKF